MIKLKVDFFLLAFIFISFNICLNFNKFIFKHMIIKYSYNKIKEHAHINHLIKKHI
jgi:hypothetical protein